MIPDPATRPILLVEDNPVDLDLTLRALARRRITHPIQVARDGAEALAWLPRWRAGEPLPLVAEQIERYWCLLNHPLRGA
jgi:hypothetical protein